MSDAYSEALFFEDVAVKDTGPEVVFEDVGLKDFVRYAGASGDFNPIHYHESYAADASNEDVFGQGMFTAGIAGHMVADWLGLGNVRTFRVRANARVWPGDTLTVHGTVTEVNDSTRTVTVEFDVENQDEESVMSGDATAILPSRSDS